MQNYNDTSTECHPAGNIKYKYYYLNGQLHRTNGPAIIEYRKNGRLFREVYVIYNDWHRIDGPAWIEYDTNGQINRTEHWFNNQKININKFICRMIASINKTETLLQILKDKPELKPIFIAILPKMFKNDINPSVIDNLDIFL